MYQIIKMCTEECETYRVERCEAGYMLRFTMHDGELVDISGLTKAQLNDTGFEAPE